MRITRHALEKFIERSKKLGLGDGRDAQFKILDLIKDAKRAHLPQIHQKNRERNHNKNIYLVNAGWRFVLSDDGEILITVERVRHEEN